MTNLWNYLMTVSVEHTAIECGMCFVSLIKWEQNHAVNWPGIRVYL